MQRAEQHIIKKGDVRYGILDNEAFKSKNLYNATLYAVRQQFFKNGGFIRYARLQHDFQEQCQFDYRQLPAKVAQWTMKMVDQNFKAFIKASKEYEKCPSKFTGKPKLPKYLDKKNGRYLITYTSQAISKKHLEQRGVIKLSGIDVEVPTKVRYEQLNQVRVARGLDTYVIEVIYDNGIGEFIPNDNGRYAAIDLGVGNFAAVTSNVEGFAPFIISGRGIKSINQFYNKQVAERKSVAMKCNGKRTTKAIRMIMNKRNRRMKDAMHKASRLVVNQLVSNDIRTLIVGYNKGWKQGIDKRDDVNQNFVCISYHQFIKYLKYKCEEVGIEFMTVNESHTSKCSFLDMEEVCHHEEYVGRRVHRGLFRSKDGRKINADVNASYNIMRKGKPKAITVYGVGAALVQPKILRI